MTAHRLTRVGVETVVTGAPRVRVTRTYAETVRVTPDPRARLTRVYVETVVGRTGTHFLVLRPSPTSEVVVRVAATPTTTPDDLADRARAINGAMRASLAPVSGGRKRSWGVRTVPLPEAEADTLRAALGAPVVGASGRWVESPVNASPSLTRETSIPAAGGRRVVIDFTLEEV